MDEAAIRTFLEELGIHKVKRSQKGWVNSPCPFAAWEHPRGQDKHPSFGIKAEPGGVSRYFCYSCKNSGSLTSLLWKLSSKTGRDYSALSAFVDRSNAPSENDLKSRAEALSYERPKSVTVGGISVSTAVAARAVDLSEIEKSDGLPEAALDGLRELDDEAREYLHQRGVGDEAIATWELGWHRSARRISLPVRDLNKKLVGLSGRSIDASSHPKYLHSQGFRRDFYLYGEHLVPHGGTVFLVEGFFDVIRLWQAGYRNAVAMLGSYLSSFQEEKLVRFFKQVIVVPDGDKPGYDAARRIEAWLGKRQHVVVAATPEGKDPADLSVDELVGLLGPPGT